MRRVPPFPKDRYTKGVLILSDPFIPTGGRMRDAIYDARFACSHSADGAFFEDTITHKALSQRKTDHGLCETCSRRQAAIIQVEKRLAKAERDERDAKWVVPSLPTYMWPKPPSIGRGRR